MKSYFFAIWQSNQCKIIKICLPSNFENTYIDSLVERTLCQPLITFVTNYHKLNMSKQQTFFVKILEDRSAYQSQWAEIRFSAGLHPSDVLGENPFLTLPVSTDSCHILVCDFTTPISAFLVTGTYSLLSEVKSPSFSLLKECLRLLIPRAHMNNTG